jgi:two-component system sensor histidine kinase ResE
VENVRAAVRNVERIVLLAGALALLISGFAGYVAATLISRRISRLGLAAERLAGGNFDERIDTRIEDEVGSLGATFNSMAASLKDAFEQVEQEKERGSAILDGMTDAVVGVDRDLNAIFLNPRARELLESAPHEFHNRLQEILAKSRYSGPRPERGTASSRYGPPPWRMAPSPSSGTSPRSTTSSGRRPSSSPTLPTS